MEQESVQLIVQKLEALAQAAGTSAEKFFGFAVQQHYINGVTGIIFGIVFICLLFFLYSFINGQVKKFGDNDDILIGKIVTTIVLIVMLILVGNFGIRENSLEVANPEYYASQELIRLLK